MDAGPTVGAKSLQGLVLMMPEGPLLVRHGETGVVTHCSTIVSGTVMGVVLHEAPPSPSRLGPKSKHKSLNVTTSLSVTARSSADVCSLESAVMMFPSAVLVLRQFDLRVRL